MRANLSIVGLGLLWAFSACGDKNHDTDSGVLIVSRTSDFQTNHEFGRADVDGWTNAGSSPGSFTSDFSPRNGKCLVFGTYESMNFPGRVRAYANVVVRNSFTAMDGGIAPNNPNYRWFDRTLRTFEESTEIFTLDLVRTTPNAETVIIATQKFMLTKFSANRTMRMKGQTILGADYLFDGELSLPPVDNLVLNPSERLEVRVCGLKSWSAVKVRSTAFDITYNQ